jgi:hypothetical protein
LSSAAVPALQTGKGAEAVKKNDNDLDELLKLLSENPRLMKELVFDPTNITSLLTNKAVRRLLSQPVTDFLKYVAGPQDGYPIAQCFKGTNVLCAKGTKYEVKCAGGTKPPLR